MVIAHTTELAHVLLKSPSVVETLAARAVHVSLAKQGLGAEELGTAEEIAARHKRTSTEKPS